MVLTSSSRTERILTSRWAPDLQGWPLEPHGTQWWQDLCKRSEVDFQQSENELGNQIVICRSEVVLRHVNEM